MIHIPGFAAALYHSAGQLGCLPGGGVAVKQTLVCRSERGCLSANLCGTQIISQNSKIYFLSNFFKCTSAHQDRRTIRTKEQNKAREGVEVTRKPLMAVRCGQFCEMSISVELVFMCDYQ